MLYLAREEPLDRWQREHDGSEVIVSCPSGDDLRGRVEVSAVVADEFSNPATGWMQVRDRVVEDVDKVLRVVCEAARILLRILIVVRGAQQACGPVLVLRGLAGVDDAVVVRVDEEYG
jgi:hypothetical protein